MPEEVRMVALYVAEFLFAAFQREVHPAVKTFHISPFKRLSVAHSTAFLQALLNNQKVPT